MITSSNFSQSENSSVTNSDSSIKAIPNILQEEDKPFVEANEWKTIETKELEFNRSLSIFKHLTAKNLISICIAGIALTMIIDIFLSEPSELVKETFEFFKLLALTTTGYLFGSNKASS